jgi:RPA family protein
MFEMKRRSPYKRYRIETINRSEVTKDSEERWRLISQEGKTIFRIWILGIVTEKYDGENQYIGLKVEDGSGVVRVKSWDGKLESINKWDKVEILGQIQISEQDESIDVFITPDIVESIADDNWNLYHRLKIVQNQNLNTEIQVRSAKVEGIDLGVASLEDLKTKIQILVKQLDEGSGVTFEIITKKLPKIDESQIYEAITELLDSGEFFEPQSDTYSNAFD